MQDILTVGMTLGSLLLFCYWFRYACHLILVAATLKDYAQQVATANQLSFPEARVWLSEGAAEFGRVKQALDHDFAVLAKLMTQAESAQDGIERKMLAVHYRLMNAWYSVAKSISASAARQALEEMSLVVTHFANSVGAAAESAAAA